jgi:2-oxoglutarate ferredoxin oxidoreductase subunit alpha
MTEAFRMADAEVAVVAYGSVSRSARRAVLQVREKGLKAGILQLVTLFPFPRQKVEGVLRQCRAVLVPEMNMGQISREVKRVNEGLSRVVKHNRIDGQFMTPEEIAERLQEL